MADPLRLGITSQTPLVRMKREVADGEEPLPLDQLTRGVDYSVTPGGVARMIHAFVRAPAARGRVRGEWVTLQPGCSRDLSLGDLRLTWAQLPPDAAEAYKDAKEVAWEALNGLPPRVEAPASDLGTGFRSSFEAWSAANAARILARHAADPFDVFYVNDWQHLPQGRMLKGAPSVMHFHAPIDAWTPPGWADYVLRCFEGFDGVIVSTDAYARHLRALGFSKPVHRVHPWIDTGEHVPPADSAVQAVTDRFGIGASDRVILNVGRMDPVKGQDRLLRAFAKVLRQEPDARLVLVGNGSFSSSPTAGLALSKGKVWRAKLEALAKELRIDERVVFTGHLPQGDVEAMLARCDVFAFPSVAEGFGLAVVEAWLHRKPAVVSHGAGISDLVRDGENGFVVDAADAEELAEALLRALALPDGGAAMGSAARASAIKHCSARQAAREVFEILEAHASGTVARAPEAGEATA